MPDVARPTRAARRHRRWLIPPVVMALWVLAACENSIVDPPITESPRITSIAVSSPIGELLAAGGQVSLDATVTLDDGRTSQPPLNWSSANTAIATVDASGVVTGLAAGTTNISAQAEGTSGTLSLTVVEADLPAISALLDDPFAERLLAQLGAVQGTLLGDAWQACGDAQATGNLVAIRDCVSDARTQLDQDAEPDLGPIAALLDLVVDWVDRLLNA